MKDKPNLQKYIDSYNCWRSIGTTKKISFPTTKRQCRHLFFLLSCDLSYENVSCRGQLSQEQMKEKACFLLRCWTELEHVYGARVSQEQLWHGNENDTRSLKIAQGPSNPLFTNLRPAKIYDRR